MGPAEFARAPVLGDPYRELPMNLEDWLRKERAERSARGEWPQSLDGVRFFATDIWKTPLHRHYPDHSVTHSERIIEKLSKLTEDLMMQPGSLSSNEVFVLLASAYLHDIGMQDERFKGCDLDQIRMHHHELTRKIITDRRAPLGLGQVPDIIVDTIASVAEAHRRTNLRERTYKEFADGDRKMRPRLLAALLRLADELDIDYNRVPMRQLSLRDISVKSEFHWCLCYLVSGVEIQNGYITVHYQFPQGSNDYHRIVEPIVRGKIQEEFPVLKEILWTEYACKVEMNPKYEVRNIETVERMSPEVMRFAIGVRRSMLVKERAHHSEGIEFCDSMSAAARSPARGESPDE